LNHRHEYSARAVCNTDIYVLAKADLESAFTAYPEDRDLVRTATEERHKQALLARRSRKVTSISDIEDEFGNASAPMTQQTLSSVAPPRWSRKMSAFAIQRDKESGAEGSAESSNALTVQSHNANPLAPGIPGVPSGGHRTLSMAFRKGSRVFSAGEFKKESRDSSRRESAYNNRGSNSHDNSRSGGQIAETKSSEGPVDVMIPMDDVEAESVASGNVDVGKIFQSSLEVASNKGRGSVTKTFPSVKSLGNADAQSDHSSMDEGRRTSLTERRILPANDEKRDSINGAKRASLVETPKVVVEEEEHDTQDKDDEKSGNEQ
jgi:hypothetical protein